MIQTLRHGYLFIEAAPTKNPPLPDREDPQVRLWTILAKTEYRRRQRRLDEPVNSLRPSIPADILKIQTAAIEAFAVATDQFYSRNRTANVSNARIASMGLCRAYTLRTFEEIGEAHGRHHWLVLYACQRLPELQRVDPNFAAAIAHIETTIRQQGSKPWKN